MSKTVRSKNNSPCNKESLEDQLMEIKSSMKKEPSKKPVPTFVTTQVFKLTEFVIDSAFPNIFGETEQEYISRNVINYTAVIVTLEEMIEALFDPLTKRPLVNEFNWVLMAIDIKADIEKVQFDKLTTENKHQLLQVLIDESNIRLTMLQISVSPVVPELVIPVFTTQESESIMNNVTPTNIDQAAEAISKAANSAQTSVKAHTVSTEAQEEIEGRNLLRRLEESSEKAAVNSSTVFNAEEEQMYTEFLAFRKAAKEAKQAEDIKEAKKLADVATEEAAKAAKAEKKATSKETPTSKWKIASYVAAGTAVIGAAAYLYKKNFSAVNAAVSDAATTASNVASEQVVGG